MAKVHPSIVAVVDTETTGLDPDRHPIWEVGLIRYDLATDTEVSRHVWQPMCDLDTANPVALEIGRFHERRWAMDDQVLPSRFAAEFAELTQGLTWVGAVPSFDEERLRRLLAFHGVQYGWHYHLIDVEPLALGYIHGRDEVAEDLLTFPIDSRRLSMEVGVDPSAYDAHTALGDCEWALDTLRAVLLDRSPASREVPV